MYVHVLYIHKSHLFAMTSRNLFLLLSVLLHPGFFFLASGRCYWIDATEALDRFPCYDLNTVGASMCCDSALRDSFISCANGICAYTFTQGTQGPNDVESSSFWRDSCSDPTWRDPACLAMAPGKLILRLPPRRRLARGLFSLSGELM